MQLLTMSFWLGTLAVCYTYIIYPLLIALLARVRPRKVQRRGAHPTGVSLVLAARNEQEFIERRLSDLLENLSSLDHLSEIIVISDGSTDETVSLARKFGDQVIVIDWQANRGKAAALNHGVSLARHEVVVFADVRQRWSPEAVKGLLEPFRDPAVGAVSGELVLELESGVLAGVGLYWKFEKWLRERESNFCSQIGVTGAISAVRKQWFSPIPDGLILDDVFWPMQVAIQGQRVVYQPAAKAFDRLPEQSGDELRRKLRTLVGNFQLVTACPGLLLPWVNPLWWQFISHKMMRLVAPWALLVTFFTSGFLPHPFYQTAFVGQLLGLGVGIIGLVSQFSPHTRVFSAAGSFLLLHVAAWLAFWYWILGQADTLWGKTSYRVLPKDQAQLP